MTRTILLLLLSIPPASAFAQEFLPLWPPGGMPNSRGVTVADSVANERIVQVGTPGIALYLPPATQRNGTAVLLCPGGGYQRLAYETAGVHIARWCTSLGISAFVLKYRLPHSPDLVQREIGPLQDAQRAIRIIRHNAARWGIRPDRIGAMGTSAGGHLAASLGTIRTMTPSAGDAIDSLSPYPDFLILVSPVISMGEFTHGGSRDNLLGPAPSRELLAAYSLERQVTPSTPPSFVVHALNDKAVPVQNSLLFTQACVDKNVPASLHLFPSGGHAIGVGTNPGSTALWMDLCAAWLEENGWMPPLPPDRPQ